MTPPGSPSTQDADAVQPNDSAGPHLALVLALLMLFGVSAAMHPTSEPGRLAIAGKTLPHTCTYRRWTGHDCPGCGLTRSWVATADADLPRAFDEHHLGPISMGYAGLQTIRHGAWLVARPRRGLISRWGALLDKGLLALGVALIARWIVLLFLL